jgi:DNA-directed RNA polymerase subunit omega
MTDTRQAAETRPHDTALNIPDDPELSIYRFIIVAAKRARQLQSGARPKVVSGPRKVTRIAVDEVRRGLIPYIDPERTPPAEEQEEESSNQ